MKPYGLTFLLILTLASATHAASEYTITNRHRVIEETTLDPRNVPVGTKLPAVNFATLEGKTHNLDVLTKHGPVVFTFLATECPVAQRYTMRLKRAPRCVQHNTYLRRSLRQRKRRCRRGEGVRREGGIPVLHRERHDR